MGPTRPLAGLGDYQTFLRLTNTGQLRFYVQLFTVRFVGLKMYEKGTFCRSKNVQNKGTFCRSEKVQKFGKSELQNSHSLNQNKHFIQTAPSVPWRSCF